VACIYDDDWYVGSIVERSDKNNDVLVSFMQQSRGKFVWPSHPDRCWIPFECVLCSVASPMPESHGARLFVLAKKDYTNASELFKTFRKQF
jgi:hypothetical protein